MRKDGTRQQLSYIYNVIGKQIKDWWRSYIFRKYNTLFDTLLLTTDAKYGSTLSFSSMNTVEIVNYP